MSVVIATGVVLSLDRVSSGLACRAGGTVVEGSGQLSVGGPCGFEFLGSFVEFTLFVGEVLLKHGDALLKLIDISRCAET
ncbi:hypothetical protein [Streptomyces niveus]|uniref:hypothetical protein n=1 Tax=Streptomyces niveus TaxID=193462 RepID=UPI00341C1032